MTAPKPLYPEDLHVGQTFVTPSKSRPDRGMVRTRNETRNQHGEPVQISTLGIVAWRRPA